MRIIIKFYNIITKIYQGDLFFFLLLFLLMSITDVYSNALNGHYWGCLYTVIYAYVFSGLICMFFSLFDKHTYTRKLLNIVTVLFFYIYIVFNTYSLFLTLKPFNGGTFELLLSTNYNEIIEFLSIYLSIYHIIIIFVVLFLICGISQKKQVVKNSFIVNTLSVVLLINTSLLLINRYDSLNTPLGRVYNLYAVKHLIEKTPDLELFKSRPDFIPLNEDHPENIVVIIGESFAKTHSSLYGYNKITNPLLSIHKNNGYLHLFNNVVAPASHTLAAFKAIMSTYSYNRECDVWYKHTTIPECFSRLGYKTTWISNQERYGIRDNIPTRFAQLCDSVIFTQKKISEKFKDEKLLSYINEYPQLLEFFVLHLMGQHNKYTERYPDKFSFFSEEDYEYLPKHQRKIVAEYDNATLYNDYVVDSIIKTFLDKEAIIFYISDHGQDIYYSDNNYCGHGIEANAKSDSIGRDIPFMIYTSPQMKKRYPKMIERIQESVEKQFNTEDLIYSLLDISGYRFKNNNDVERFSIFSSISE